MIKNMANISRWQQFCLGFLCLLSPIIRLIPGQTAALAGPFGWISAILSAVPLVLLFLLIRRFLKNALPNEGFAELYMRGLGKVCGKALILIFTLWLIFYAAFTLHSGAHRYISAAYQNSPNSVFIIVLLVLALLAALGKFKPFSRTAEVFFPLLAAVILLVVFLAAPDVDRNFLPPFVFSQAPRVLSGCLPIVSVVSLAVYFGFLEGRTGEKEKRGSTMFWFLLVMIVVIIGLILTTAGTLGSEVAAKYHFPFFSMVRNISLFDFLDRLDAVVLALWVVTDFAMVATLLFIVINNIRIIVGFSPDSAEGARLFDFRNGRWIIWAVALIIGVLAHFIVPNSFELTELSKNIVPRVNLIFTFGLLPVTILICLLRRKV